MIVGRCRQKVGPVGGIDVCVGRRLESGTGLPRSPRTVLAGATTAAVAGWAEQANPQPSALPVTSTAAAPVAAAPVTGSSRIGPPSTRAPSSRVRPPGPAKTTRPLDVRPGRRRPPRPARRPSLVQRRLRRLGRRTRLRPLRRRAATDRRPPPRSLPPSLQPSTRPEPSRGCPRSPSTPTLQSSAHGHDLAMAAANQLSHQLPGEPDLGTRETNAGVSWTAAGENIGWTSDMTQAGALVDRGEHARRDAAE